MSNLKTGLCRRCQEAFGIRSGLECDKCRRPQRSGHVFVPFQLGLGEHEYAQIDGQVNGQGLQCFGPGQAGAQPCRVGYGLQRGRLSRMS